MKFKIGDKVRVKNPIGVAGGIHHDSTIDRGTYSVWVTRMDDSVGKEFKIENASEDYGYCLENGWEGV